MTHLKTTAIIATLISGLGVTAASAASVNDLIATNGIYDRSAEAISATRQNLATLGVSTRKGDVITSEELTAIQSILRDQGSFESKARRVDLVVNGDSNEFGNGFNAR
ncbi:hypothetical protein ACOI1H_02260 [Loktanella sp. DJP18]|uniref:hypothetical protein n=1 Tax=Loktanella sp. DJP18 TaxID=3409788 RepID=UPI003BB57D62